MKLATARLLVASVFLFGWIGWLGYLAATKTDPVVLSRSQIIASSHFVLAEVSVDPATGLPVRDVKIVRDLRPGSEPLAGMLRIPNIAEARVGGKQSGFQAGETYLLMLTKSLVGYELATPARSPGYEGTLRAQPWVYLWSAPGVEEQFDRLVP